MVVHRLKRWEVKKMVGEDEKQWGEMLENMIDTESRFELISYGMENTKGLVKKYKRIIKNIEKVDGKDGAVDAVRKEIMGEKKKLVWLKEKFEETKKMNIEMEIEMFAEGHGLKFGSKKDELIKTIIKKGGYCPCRKGKNPENLCPCEPALKDIMKNGRCLCGLFVAPVELKQMVEPVKSLSIEYEDALKLGKMVKDEEIQKMIERNKLTVFDFYADWCQPCKELGKDLEKIKTKDIVIKRINVEEDGKLSDKIGIYAIPFVAVFDKNKQPFTAFTGYPGKEILRDVIKKAGG